MSSDIRNMTSKGLHGITARFYLLALRAKSQRNREGAQALYRRALSELQRRGEVAHWWEQEALS